MFREPRQRSTRKQLEKDRLDPLKSHKPEPPVAGPGDCDLACDLQRGWRGRVGSLIENWDDLLLLDAALSLRDFTT